MPLFLPVLPALGVGGVGISKLVLGGLVAGSTALLPRLLWPKHRSLGEPPWEEIVSGRLSRWGRREGDDLLPGDHIRVACRFGPFPYYHHGIVSENADGIGLSVIHYDDGLVDLGRFTLKHRKRAAAIRATDLERFAGSSGVAEIELVERPSDANAVLNRAYSALTSALWGEGTYSILTHNCEHFATWCISGQSQSVQVVNYSILAGTVISGGLSSVVISQIGESLGLGCLLPGVGWLLLGAGIVYASYKVLQGGLVIRSNGYRAEVEADCLRRVALAHEVPFGMSRWSCSLSESAAQ